MPKFDDMVFKGIKVEFLSNGSNCPSPLYYIVYEYMGTTYQGYVSPNILTICRCLIAYFGVSDDDIELALKSVADSITEACKKLKDEVEK